MATENPRIVAYPDLALYERLRKYQQDKGIKSLSAALTQVLHDHFQEVESKPTENEALTAIRQELTAVREQVTQLSEVVQRLEENSQRGSE